jgi:hypothetical protein
LSVRVIQLYAESALFKKKAFSENGIELWVSSARNGVCPVPAMSEIDRDDDPL